MLQHPPDSDALVDLGDAFGRKFLLTIDTEEEFDWSAPFDRAAHSLTHIPQIARFQSMCEQWGAHPVYLVDWPIAGDAQAREIIGSALARGTANIGLQLHPWTNPPFDEPVSVFNSFAGNLPPEIEAAKFEALHQRVSEGFGRKPLIYRAGRYGVGASSAEMLIKAGIRIDSSVRALFDYSALGGPDFSDYPAEPYRADHNGRLLELPLTAVYSGPLRSLGRRLQPLKRRIPPLSNALAHTGLLQRLPLTPEGTRISEAIRAIDLALAGGQRLLVCSFHSPSLAPGNTPYVESEQALERFYAWFAAIFAHLARRGIGHARLEDILTASGGSTPPAPTLESAATAR